MANNDRFVTGFTDFSREGGELFELRERTEGRPGSQVRLLSNLPAYEVTSITRGPEPSITFTIAAGETPSGLMPPSFTFTGTKTKTVGRATDNDLVVSGSNISRPHLTVHYDKKRHN